MALWTVGKGSKDDPGEAGAEEMEVEQRAGARGMEPRHGTGPDVGQARCTEDPKRLGPQTREGPPQERGEGAGPQPKRRTLLFTTQTASSKRKRGRCPRAPWLETGGRSGPSGSLSQIPTYRVRGADSKGPGRTSRQEVL